MPPTALTVVVPPSTAPAVPVPAVKATVTALVADVTVLPAPSATAIATGGAMAMRAPVLVGSVRTMSCVGAPAETVKVLEVAEVRPASGAVATIV